jgi:hypothetical protein
MRSHGTLRFPDKLSHRQTKQSSHDGVWTNPEVDRTLGATVRTCGLARNLRLPLDLLRRLHVTDAGVATLIQQLLVAERPRQRQVRLVAMRPPSVPISKHTGFFRPWQRRICSVTPTVMWETGIVMLPALPFQSFAPGSRAPDQ